MRERKSVAPMRRLSWGIRHVFLIFALAAIVLTVSRHAANVQRATSESLLTTRTYAWVSAFVFDHGRWPRSWDEIEIYVGRGIDIEEVKSQVAVDFDADILEILKQDVNSFVAITPRNFEYQHDGMGNLVMLQHSIRKSVQKE